MGGCAAGTQRRGVGCSGRKKKCQEKSKKRKKSILQKAKIGKKVYLLSSRAWSYIQEGQVKEKRNNKKKASR
jgi:hypothetical protein